jgi:hypothetical protein
MKYFQWVWFGLALWHGFYHQDTASMLACFVMGSLCDLKYKLTLSKVIKEVYTKKDEDAA